MLCFLTFVLRCARCVRCGSTAFFILTLFLLLTAPLVRASDVLYLYIWNNYISAQTAARFEAWCGCTLKQDYYSDNEEMLAKLEAGASGYDLLVPTGNAVQTLIRKHELRPVEKNRLPNFSNLDRAYLGAWYDPENRYAVPYASTVTLLGYNVDKLRALGLPNDTWALIFEPKYLEQLKGRVMVLNSQRELMAAALRYLGYSAQDANPEHWYAARDLILRAKPYWAAFSNSTYIKELAIGNIWVAHGYSSDMFRAREDAIAARRPFRIGFSIPKEGAVLAVDNFVIHKSSRRPDLAHRFIDFMLNGENAGDVSNLIGAGNPNAAAGPYIRPEISSDSALFPKTSDMSRLEMLRDLEPQQRRLMSRLWTEIKVK